LMSFRITRTPIATPGRSSSPSDGYKRPEATFAEFAGYARSQARPVRPECVVGALRALVAPDAIGVADAGTPCPYLSAYLGVRAIGRHFITNRAHGALGYGLAAAIGAAFARPGAQCIAVMGDGSFGFTAGELETAVRYKLPITFIVLANATYGWIKAGQRSGFGGRYFSVDFSVTDHAAVARSFGLSAWRVEEPAEVKPTIAQALASAGPTLIDIVVQPLHEAHAPVSEWIA